MVSRGLNIIKVQEIIRLQKANIKRNASSSIWDSKIDNFLKKDFKYKFVSQRVSKKRELNKPLN